MNQQLWSEVQAMRKAWGDLTMDRFLSTHQQAKGEGMKVQSKDPKITGTWMVIEQSQNYFIAYAVDYGPLSMTCLSKQNYEPVQEWKETGMKVQRRDDPKQVYAVIEESANYYLVARERTIIAFSKAEYVPVQEWVNVTKECTFHREQDYMWFRYNNKVCGHYNHPDTRIVVNGSGNIRVEALR